MPSQVQGWPWPHERAVRAAVAEHWGLRDELRPIEAKASRIWQAGGHVVKLARDEPAHFGAGLLASERVERAGVATGTPVRTGAGELCVPLMLGRESWALAVLHRVDGIRLSATDRIPLPAYTAAFLEGYRRSNELTAAAAAAVPLFQRLRIASHACYVTDPAALAAVEAWMRRAFTQ